MKVLKAPKARTLLGIICIMLIPVIAGCSWAGSAKDKPAPNGSNSRAKQSKDISNSAGDSKAVFAVVKLEAGQATVSQFASQPVLSPDKKREAYIDPLEFELIGNVYVSNLETGTLDKLTLNQEILPQFTPKKLSWSDNSHLLAVIGYAYGTVSVGGDLYLVDTSNGTAKLVYQPLDNEEVIEARQVGSNISMKIAQFDDNMMKYQVVNREIKLPGKQ